MINIKSSFVYLILILTTSAVFCQQTSHRIMFYNVENLFDIRNDSLTNDDEFTPEGTRNWNNHRFYRKLNNIYKVIVGVGEWNSPAVVALCEIENRFVLNKLIYDTPLKNFDYKIIHFDSPDRRGIDVALLYRKDVFEPDTSFPVAINFPNEPNSKTRDILYVKGSFDGKNTLHVLINHWPSRYGGYMETKPKREYVASLLKSVTDSLIKVNLNSKIIIMGDFNDGPDEDSFTKHLLTKNDTIEIKGSDLINLMAFCKGGTLKYQGSWDLFDQVIVSGAMLKNGKGYKISDQRAIIFRKNYLLTEDEKYLGQKPFRTYNGFKYLGGFSDHLPVYVDVVID